MENTRNNIYFVCYYIFDHPILFTTALKESPYRKNSSDTDKLTDTYVYVRSLHIVIVTLYAY